MSVWKRLQRVGKKAAKFDFTVSYHELTVECSSMKWIPHKLAVNWTRRSRCIRTKHLDWIASGESKSSTKGYVDWRLPENVHGVITLYHDASSPQFDDKEWTFAVEKHEKGGRFKVIASQKVNMRDYVSMGGAPKRVTLAMKPNSDKYSNVMLVVSISSALVKEGMATDEDMQSIASLMSAGPSDVGNLGDFDDELPDGGEDGGAAGHNADHAADDGIDRADTMSQLTALAAEISKFTLPEGSYDGACNGRSQREVPVSLSAGHGRLKHVQSEVATPHSLSSSSATLLPAARGMLQQSSSAVVLGSAGRGGGSTSREALPSKTTAAVGQATTSITTALPTAASTPSFVERPFYAGTPPSTPPEERKAAVASAQPRAITPPPLTTEPCIPCDQSSPSSAAEGALSASTVRTNPSEDLLNWAKSVTSHYKNIIVTNFTTSWRNGLAFCAVIHHFRPDLIDYDSLVQADVRGNNKLAFDTGALLGIDKILEPSDMMALKVPDKLQVMTYIHAMRSRLDPSSAQPDHEAAMEDSMSDPHVTSSPSDHGSTPPYSRPAYVLSVDLAVCLRAPNVEEVDSDLDAAIACQVYGKDLVRQQSQSNSKQPPSSSSLLTATQPEPAAAAAVSAATSAAPQPASVSVHVAGVLTPAVPSQPVARRVSRTEAIIDPAATSATAAATPAAGKADSSSKPPQEAVRSNAQQGIPKPQPKQPLMTRNQLLNPFDSDDDDDAFATSSNKPPLTSAVDPHSSSTTKVEFCTPAAQLVVKAAEQPIAAPGKSAALSEVNKSRQEELKDRARQLIERARQDAVCTGTDGQGRKASGGADSVVDTRLRVREKARLLLEQMSAECSAASNASTAASSQPVPDDGLVVQPTIISKGSYVKEKGYQFYQFSRKEPDISAAHTASPALISEHPFASAMVTDAGAHPPEAVVGGTRLASRAQGSASLNRPCLSSALTDVAMRLKDGAATSATSAPTSSAPQMERKGSSFSSGTGSADGFLDASEYVSEELSLLEKEQQRLDGRASKLEISLRRAMDNGDEEREEKLTRQWFKLVNRKHELIRRQAELNILNKEHDLERRYELLNRELRHMMALEDWQKSQSQRHREALLLAELVTIVDKRDELVRAMEEQQNALESDQELEKAVHSLPIPKEKPCCVQ